MPSCPIFEAPMYAHLRRLWQGSTVHRTVPCSSTFYSAVQYCTAVTTVPNNTAKYRAEPIAQWYRAAHVSYMRPGPAIERMYTATTVRYGTQTLLEPGTGIWYLYFGCSLCDRCKMMRSHSRQHHRLVAIRLSHCTSHDPDATCSKKIENITENEIHVM